MTAIDKPDLPPRTLRPVGRTRSFPTVRTVMALILREMVTTYGRSPGGYIWALLEPAAGVALLTAIFSLGFRSPPIGSSFAIFYATGIVPFLMFSGLASKVGSALLYSKSLLTYPSVTYLDALVARFLLNASTQLMVAYIVLTYIIVGMGVPVSLDFSRIFLGFSMILSLGLGIGILNGFLFAVAPVWQQIWSILTRPLVLLSGVIFIYERVPVPYNEYLLYNPLVHVIAIIRSGFYARYDAAYASPLYVFTISGVTLVAGLLFLHRYHRDILFR